MRQPTHSHICQQALRASCRLQQIDRSCACRLCASYLHHACNNLDLFLQSVQYSFTK